MSKRGLTSARALRMDAEQLDFPDESFDRVFSGFGVLFLPAQADAVAGFRRVLKSGGRVGVSHVEGVTQVDDLGSVLHDLGLGSGMAPGWITEADHLRELLESAGFSGVKVSESPRTFVYADIEEYWRTAMTTGLRRIWRSSANRE